MLIRIAFGEIDGYGPSLHVSVPEAIKLWGYPAQASDISAIFVKHVCGEISAMPWSEEGLSAETMAIKDELCKLIGQGWWTVASQPAVNGVRSNDPVFGWGPKNGFVFQKVNSTNLTIRQSTDFDSHSSSFSFPQRTGRFFAKSSTSIPK
jgi:hypothetical protein